MDTREDLTHALRGWVRQAMRLSMSGSLRFMRGKGLAMPHMVALVRIHSQPGCSVGDIAQHLDVTNAAASQMLDRLVRLGFLDRQEDPQDRRGKLLSLTETGLALLREGLEAREDWIPALVSRFGDDEVEALAGAMRILSRNGMDTDAPHGDFIQGTGKC